MEILQCLFLLWIITIVLLFQNVTNVGGGRHHHHINKKQMSKISPKLSPDNAPQQSPSFPSDMPSPQPNEPGNTSSTSCIFDVTDFGAIGDGDTDDTNAFKAAWKEACQVQNSIVLVPSDCTFLITSTIFSGPCEPGLVFQVDGVLMPPDGPDSWPRSDSDKQWLVFYNLDGFTLTGTGTIEGNGQKWWDLPCKPHKGPNGKTLPGPCNSPALIRFFMSSNLAVTNLTDVTFKNIKGTYDVRSPPIHFACSDTVACTNITMSEVELLPYEGVLVDDPFCWNAYGMQETLTIPPIDCLQEGMPQSLTESYLYGC